MIDGVIFDGYVVRKEESEIVYLKRLIYENVGPIEKIDLSTQFEMNGNPKPLILVGKNGSGKSILLSNIVDAFYELANITYSNATVSNESRGHQYFKTINPDQIRIGSKYMTSYAQFAQDEVDINYIFKSGNCEFEQYCKENGLSLPLEMKWNESNYKKCTCEKKKVEDVFEKDIVGYFSPMRYEKPSWIGCSYHENTVRNVAEQKYNGILRNPITVTIDSNITLQWLFDIITDSRADLKKMPEGRYSIVYPSTNVIDLLNISRANVEKLMSAIMGENVTFRMGNRSSGGRRFSICFPTGNPIVNSIDALSTGQLALFELFATIIRYADSDDINLSHRLHEIAGIVVIDEIELHLHSSLQRNVLPKLLKLFPKVQFIITSHSPLFLLGMKEQYGDDGFSVIDMPDGKQITVEQFSEFENAYNYYSDTEKHQAEIKQIIDANTHEKALIVTEGATDWRHFKAAYEALKEDTRCKEWLPLLEFDFLEYDPKNSKSSSFCKLQMSCSELKTMCKNYSYTSHRSKVIFIADNDDKDTKKVLGSEFRYRAWGNNVYSFCLPVPSFRDRDEICVEHLYLNDEIKREIEIDGIKRRIYLGNEFNEDCFMVDSSGSTFCCTDRNVCGPNKIAIIDGGDKKKVIKVPGGDGINYALSKMKFANAVLKKEEPFSNMDFSAFIPVFEIIKDILTDTKAAAKEEK